MLSTFERRLLLNPLRTDDLVVTVFLVYAIIRLGNEVVFNYDPYSRTVWADPHYCLNLIIL